jgi:hypothetical protein
MSLPKSCEVPSIFTLHVGPIELTYRYYKIYPRKELASRKFEFFKPAKETLQEGGFIIYDPKFRKILGKDPKIQVIAENAEYPFAHEAGVFMPLTGEIFITSNHVRAHGKKHIQISKVKKTGPQSYECEEIEP